ncbi:MAG: T9SS type B sorting domain-containing protein [Ferruginibacter sp.]
MRIKAPYHWYKNVAVILIFLLLNPAWANSQCPENIDFETGTFNGWTCYLGTVQDIGGENVITLNSVPAPVLDEHTMLSSFPGDGLDEYCGFPKNCPNGSGHSIKLGNDQSGGRAEGLSYTFTIPPTTNKFSLTYNYAVVFEDPGHPTKRQPRLEIEVINVTDNLPLECFSFSFVAYNSLPGFFTAPTEPNGSPIRYKDWTTNTIYLNGYQGKTIRLFIRTADCTYSIHFGYAYIDVSSKCENGFAGETFCAQDTAVDVVAPSGYQEYYWYNSTFSQLLSTQQLLHLQPPPTAATSYAVALVPFPGYGCEDTLIVELQDTLSAKAIAGPDQILCNYNPVRLGVPPVSGMIYKWTPAYGLSDPNISNPTALPGIDTTYILSIKSIGGGCQSEDTVKVAVRNIDNSLVVSGDSVYCYGVSQFPVLKVQPVNIVQWYHNGSAIPGADQLTYTVTAPGSYYAMLLSNVCSDPIQTRIVFIPFDTASAGVRYPEISVAYNFKLKLASRNFNNGVQWSPFTSLDNRYTSTPYFKGVNSALYTIRIADSLGCFTVDTQYVRTYKKIAIYVPSAFTPDGDGLNDFLRPLLLGFQKVKYFRVYNRWGKLLFEANNDFPGWNGKVNNVLQEAQSVIWTIQAEDLDGSIHTEKGSSFLMK